MFYQSFLELWVIVAPDFSDYQSPGYVSTDIPYSAVGFYDQWPIANAIDKGKPVETFKETIMRKLLSYTRDCGLLEDDVGEGLVKYAHAICTNSCIPGNRLQFGLSPSYLPCQDKYGINFGVCCLAHKTRSFSANFKDEDMFWDYEPSDFHFYDGVFMSHHNWNRMLEDRPAQSALDAQKLKNTQFQMELSQELVCGLSVKKNVFSNKPFYENKTRPYEKLLLMFFCMDPRLCSISTSGDFRTNPAWDSFCQSRLHKGSSAAQRVKTRCCHPANAQAGYFSQQLFDWRFPQLPWFLRYAPGVRSNFMCEVYNRYVCKGTENTCFLSRGINRPSGRPFHINAVTIREFPHIARLGIMARNVLLFHCLGSLISRRFILSAWTCREAHGITTNIVLLGDDDTGSANANTEQFHMISEIRNPTLENYDAPGDPPILYEPTLYKTTRDVIFNEYVRPACIYYDPMSRPTEGIVAYFGKAKEDAPEGRYLRKSVLPIHGDLYDPESYYKQCRAKQFYNARHLNEEYFHHGASMIHQFCAGDAADKTTGPCKYDRGAPIQRLMNKPYCSWNIMGVLSSTRWNCFHYTPFVFHNISYFVRLIEDIVWPIPFMNPEIASLDCGFTRPSYWTPT